MTISVTKKSRWTRVVPLVTTGGPPLEFPLELMVYDECKSAAFRCRLERPKC